MITIVADTSSAKRLISAETLPTRTCTRGGVAQRTLAENMQLPEFFPPFTRLLAGHDETTWLELAPAREQRTWQMLDARGNVAGMITVPRNTTILAASRERLWGIETDQDGLQHIVRYRVSR